MVISSQAIRFGQDGWLEDARRVPSPNHDHRPEALAVDLLVIHYISLPAGHFAGDAIERLFTNRMDPQAHPSFQGLVDLKVSAHFLIRRHGELLQFVSGNDRAWHAGVSHFRGRDRCNDFSIGIELEGNAVRPFTTSQYRVLARLTHALVRRWPLRYVAGHSDIAPGRKEDPGPLFDWNRYEQMTISCGLQRPFPTDTRTNPQA
jgi:N-acetyl-anhydromuramoyl-L-alanine amidase